MLLAASGLSCFRSPQADSVGETMPAAPRKVQQITGRNACYARRPRSRLSTPGRCPRRTAGGRTATNCAESGGSGRHSGGDAVADKIPSGLNDALSVGNNSYRTVPRQSSGRGLHQPTGGTGRLVRIPNTSARVGHIDRSVERRGGIESAPVISAPESSWTESTHLNQHSPPSVGLSVCYPKAEFPGA